MAQRTFDSLVQRLLLSAPGCPQPVVLHHIRAAAIEACERTLAWRYEQPMLPLTPGCADYPYECPDKSEVHAFLTVSINGRPVVPSTLEEVHARYFNWPEPGLANAATPQYIVHLDADTFALAPIPDAGTLYNLRMIVALKPLRDAVYMDKTAMDDLEDVIMHGALRELLILPAKPWSDRELAAYHAKQFIAQAAERRARALLGAGRAAVSVRMRPLA